MNDGFERQIMLSNVLALYSFAQPQYIFHPSPTQLNICLAKDLIVVDILWTQTRAIQGTWMLDSIESDVKKKVEKYLHVSNYGRWGTQ